MRFDQCTSYLQVAAALSLAGWVARTPDANTDPSVLNNNYGYSQGLQNQRFHPYASSNQPQWNNNFQGICQNQYYNDQSQMLLQNSNPYVNQQQQLCEYQSKDALDRFRASVELQELTSWQEAFRRGDLNGRHNVVFPATTKKDEDFKKPRSISSNPSDDGYVSGDGSAHSPAPSSVFSSASVTSGNIEDVHSPLSDAHQLSVESPAGSPGAVGGAGAMGYPSVTQDTEDFDIDEILFGKDSAVKPKKNSFVDGSNFHGSAKTPFDNLKLKDEELDFVNSPLKSPSFDEFLASPSPSKSPQHSVLNSSVDDQFQMHFSNASVSENKFLSNPLVDLDEIDPAIIDEALAYDEELDKALVDSLSGKETHSPNSPVIPYQANAPIKNEDFSFSEASQHAFGQDFNKFKQEIDSDFPTKNVPSFTNQPEYMLSQMPMMNLNHRTFTPHPAAQIKNPKGKMKKQASKLALIWPDFPYTQDELIEMPVEKFNEVIKSLSAVRQHEAKDIRRKGKNKLAARNCRKRKMDVIDCLDSGVGVLEKERARLLEERQRLMEETRQLKKGTQWLNDYIFQHLRDANGSPYSSSEYSLQYTSDGNVYLVPSGPASQSKSIVNVN